MRGLPIGYAQSGAKLRYETRRGWDKKPGESSSIVIGPAREGKGTCFIVPWLLDYEGSCIVVDPKGQNCCVTARHRQRMGHEIIILAPFPVWPDYIGHFPHSGYDPMIGLDPRVESYGVDADALADGIVVKSPHDRDPHFADTAQLACSGLMMYVRENARPEKQNLVTVYEIASGRDLFAVAEDAVAKGGLSGHRLARFAEPGAAENRELASVRSTLNTNLKFISNAAIMRSLLGPPKGHKPWHWKDLRKRKITVYLILPVRYLSACSRWLRIILASALNELLTEEHRGLPVAFIIDEAAALQHLQIVEDTMALNAGMGVNLIPIFQDYPQMKSIYGERADSFLSCAGCQIFLKARDPVTAEMVSKLSGETEVIAQNRSVSIDPRTGEPQVSDSASQQGRRVILPDEVIALGANEHLMRVTNVPDMIRAKRKPYFASNEYNGKWFPDPYHVGEKRGLMSAFGW